MIKVFFLFHIIYMSLSLNILSALSMEEGILCLYLIPGLKKMLEPVIVCISYFYVPYSSCDL